MADPRPIRVLYLDHTARLSGGELALARLLGALDRTRVEPIVALAEDGPLRELLTAQAIDTHVLPLSARVRAVRKDSLGMAGWLSQLRSLATLWRYARRISRFARQCRADLLYSNSLKSDVYGAVAARLAGLPIVWHVRDRIERGYLPGVAVWMVRWMARRLPACVVGNSRSTLATLDLSADKPTAVIPSGLTREFIERCAGPREPHPLPRIGIVGRIAHWKGQDVFLEAAAQLLRQGVRAHFSLAGSALFGEEAYEQQLRELAAHLGLGTSVEFAGFSDVPAFLRTLDVLVHASRIPEPFGQVIVEGMAAGLPVIATDGGGASEIIEHGRTGVLVPMGDAGALAAAIKGLLDDPARAAALAAAGRAHVLEHYTVERSARSSEALYARVLGAAP